MPGINEIFRHSLGQEEALRRAKGLMSELKKEHAGQISDLKEDWSGNKGSFGFKAMGFGVSGTLEITTTEVRLKGKLPFAAIIFKGQIENTIRERAIKLLS